MVAFVYFGFIMNGLLENEISEAFRDILAVGHGLAQFGIS